MNGGLAIRINESKINGSEARGGQGPPCPPTLNPPLLFPRPCGHERSACDWYAKFSIMCNGMTGAGALGGFAVFVQA